MSHNGIYNLYADNLLWDALVTASVDPMTSYSADTVLSAYPGDRVRFSTGTVTLTFHGFGGGSPGGSISPNLLAIPVSNLHGSVLSLTNNAGLNVSVPLPTIPDNGIPLTAILDFSSYANRTADIYRLVITGNSADVTLGGSIWLGQKRTLSRNYQYSFVEQEDGYGPELVNDYGTVHLADLGTRTRKFSADFTVPSSGIAELRAWHQSGRKRPILFWPNPLVNDAYVGYWSGPFAVSHSAPNANFVHLDFTEFSKGKAIA